MSSLSQLLRIRKPAKKDRNRWISDYRKFYPDLIYAQTKSVFWTIRKGFQKFKRFTTFTPPPIPTIMALFPYLNKTLQPARPSPAPLHSIPDISFLSPSLTALQLKNSKSKQRSHLCMVPPPNECGW